MNSLAESIETAAMSHSLPFLAIGHVSWDTNPDAQSADQSQPGGAVSFAAITARRLGIYPSIITSSGEEYPFDELIYERDHLIRIPADKTTTFENRYDAEGHREQRLLKRASKIKKRHLPESFLYPKMLLVSPLAQELPLNCLSWFRAGTACVAPQGWLRSWDRPLPANIRVESSPPGGMNADWDICVISGDEANAETLGEWLPIAHILVITRGALGAHLYLDGGDRCVSIPSYANHMARAGYDTTGAGDVFAAAMLINYSQSGDAINAARFASACAALSTRDVSWRAVPTTRQIHNLAKLMPEGV